MLTNYLNKKINTLYSNPSIMNTGLSILKIKGCSVSTKTLITAIEKNCAELNDENIVELCSAKNSSSEVSCKVDQYINDAKQPAYPDNNFLKTIAKQCYKLVINQLKRAEESIKARNDILYGHFSEHPKSNNNNISSWHRSVNENNPPLPDESRNQLSNALSPFSSTHKRDISEQSYKELMEIRKTYSLSYDDAIEKLKEVNNLCNFLPLKPEAQAILVGVMVSNAVDMGIPIETFSMLFELSSTIPYESIVFLKASPSLYSVLKNGYNFSKYTGHCIMPGNFNTLMKKVELGLVEKYSELDN